MTREEELINHIKEYLDSGMWKYEACYLGKEGLEIIIKALEQKTEWISVRERLPVKEGYYLTTTMYHEVFCDYWNNESFERTETIVAWMPLPEPYKMSEIPTGSENEG